MAQHPEEKERWQVMADLEYSPETMAHMERILARRAVVDVLGRFMDRADVDQALTELYGAVDVSFKNPAGAVQACIAVTELLAEALREIRQINSVDEPERAYEIADDALRSFSGEDTPDG